MLIVDNFQKANPAYLQTQTFMWPDEKSYEHQVKPQWPKFEKQNVKMVDDVRTADCVAAIIEKFKSLNQESPHCLSPSNWKRSNKIKVLIDGVAYHQRAFNNTWIDGMNAVVLDDGNKIVSVCFYVIKLVKSTTKPEWLVLD